MSDFKLNPPLTNLQAELLKLFPANIPEENHRQVKTLIPKYLLEKGREKADTVWENRSNNLNEIEKWLIEGGRQAENNSERKYYSPFNK